MKQQQPRSGSIAVSFRVAPGLDRVVETITARERRKKNAVLSLALEEYCRRHHPDLLAEPAGPCAAAPGPSTLAR
jgi:hypothetical protein